MNCSACSRPLSDIVARKMKRGIPVTGMCLPCYNASKRVRRVCQDCGATVSSYYARRCKPCSHIVWMADSALQERRIAATKAARATPEARARHARACRRIGNKRIAWCPEDRRDEYLRLMVRIGAAKARAAIWETMSPFERQLSRVREGARVVEKLALKPQAPAYSLTGNAAGMLVYG